MRGHATLPLLVDDITNGAVGRGVTDLGLTETVELLCVVGVAVDCVAEADEEADERDEHADVPAVLFAGKTSNGGEEGTTTDGGDDE